MTPDKESETSDVNTSSGTRDPTLYSPSGSHDAHHGSMLPDNTTTKHEAGSTAFQPSRDALGTTSESVSPARRDTETQLPSDIHGARSGCVAPVSTDTAGQSVEELASTVRSLMFKYDAVEDLKKDLRQALDQNINLLLDLHSVKKDLDALKHTHTLLTLEGRGSSSKLTQDLTALLAENAQLKRDVSDLQMDTQKITQDQSETKEGLTNLQTESKQIAQRMTSKEGEILKIQQQIAKVSSHVTFHAKLRNIVALRGTRKTLVMDNVLINSGNGYDTTTGVFTVPVSGLYLFLFTSLPGGGGNCHAGISVNNNDCDAVMFTQGQTSGSCHTVKSLCEGDKVCVKSRGDLKPVFYDRFTSFCGMLITPDLQ